MVIRSGPVHSRKNVLTSTMSQQLAASNVRILSQASKICQCFGPMELVLLLNDVIIHFIVEEAAVLSNKHKIWAQINSLI